MYSLYWFWVFFHNRFWYLSSVDYFNANCCPEEVTITWWGKRKLTGNQAASATTSTNRIRQMMGDNYHWDQVEGRYTADQSDDQFERKIINF